MLNNKIKIFLLFSLVLITIGGLSVLSAADADHQTTDHSSKIVKDTTKHVDIQKITKTKVNNKNTQTNKKIKTNNKTEDKEITTKKTDNTQSSDNKITKKTDKTTKSEGEGTFADLKTDTAGSEVTLAKDYIQGDGETNITISENKVIDGNGHTITATRCIFTINPGVTFTLKNALIISADYPSAYAQAVNNIDNRGSTILENVTFNYTGTGRNEGTVKYGAPVGIGAQNANLTVKDCVFDGYDTPRSCIYANYAGANVTVDNSVFTHYNTGNAAIYLSAARSNLTVTNSNFTDAGCEEYYAISYAGAIYGNNYQQNIFIENCLFDNITSDYRGAGMYVSGNTTVKNSTFKNLKQTKPTYNGGAIWVNNANGILTLENNVMEDIVSNSADIYFNNGKINSTINIEAENVVADQEASTEVKLNVTDADGNSVDFRASPFILKINDETVSATYANGTITYAFDASYDPGTYNITLEYDDTKILGTINIPNITLTVNDIGLWKYTNVSNAINETDTGSTVDINSLVVRGSTENSILIDKSITLNFNGNTINAKSGKIFDITNGANVIIKNAIITNVDNKSTSVYNTEGRIANVTGKDTSLTFENVTFINNNAPNFGSSAYGSFILVFNESSLSLTDCKISNCSGTFINNANASVTIDNTIFENNNLYQSYSVSWNALIANGGDLIITNSQFINNRVNIATIRGQSNTLPMSAYGSSYTFSNRPLTITNTLFENNYASSGRGAAVNTWNDTTIINSTFIANSQSSSNEGGAIISEDGALIIDSCTFVNNSAKVSTSWSGDVTYTEGTAIANLGGNLNIQNSIIISNITEASAIYNKAKDTELIANSNYWGSNTPEGRYASSSDADELTVSNWIMFDVTIVPMDNINYKDSITVKATLDKLTDGTSVSDYTSILPSYGNVSLTSKEGTFTDAEAEMIDGTASTTFTVGNSPFKITAKYGENEITYVGEANMPEPEVYVLNDANWTSYFNEDGTVNDELVIPNSELRFEGTFTDRNMIINIPLNLTTAETQGVLNNCNLTITADNINITKLVINGENRENALIVLNDAFNTNIKENTLTITNNEDKMVTRAIIVNGGSDNTIKDNIITTIGPEDDIKYDSDNNIELLYTTSIEANSNKITIDSNKITTKSNGKTESRGTLIGLYVHGNNDEDRIEDTKIINNEIITEGKCYDYSIKTYWTDNLLIQNNTVNSTSEDYSAGIHVFGLSDSLINNNTVNTTSDNNGYGIVIEGAYSVTTYEYYIPENVEVRNNIVNINSRLAWGIEAYQGERNKINYNNVTIKANHGVGIAVADSYSTISYNNILVNVTMEGSADSTDYLKPYTTGIRLSDNGNKPAQNSNATYNNVTVYAPNNGIGAVNLTTPSDYYSKNHKVSDNYLVSPLGYGNYAVIKNTNTMTIENNIPGTYILTDENYSTYFDDSSTFKTEYINKTKLIASGDFITNTVFIFDNVEVTFTNDGTGVFHDSQIVTMNGAKVTMNGLVFENSFEAIVLDSEGNIINNTQITINSENPVYGIQILADNNIIANSTINVTAPSNDVEYDYSNYPVYSVKTPASAALVINSSYNLVDNTNIYYTGTTYSGYGPSCNGIYLLSFGDMITNNIIKDTNVTVTGTNYTYGINVGKAKDTIIENVNINVTSDYYAVAIQLWDIDTLSITGNIYSKAASEAYGAYVTAMATDISRNIDITGLNITVDSPKSNGIQTEGGNNITIADATYNIKGENATAVRAFIDYNGHIPADILVTGLTVNIETTGDANALYFGACNNITVTENIIKANSGSEILFNQTTNAKATRNYIVIGDKTGDNGVISNEDDSIIADNAPGAFTITDENYGVFFDDANKLKLIYSNCDLTFSGEFRTNTKFIFDDVEVTLNNDGTAIFHNGQIITQNNAKVTMNGLIFENNNNAIILDSEGNIINNTQITINSEDAIHAIIINANNNIIANTTLNITAPAGDAKYNMETYALEAPAPSAIMVSSNNNLLENITLEFNAPTTLPGYAPTNNGIHLQSLTSQISNNTVRDTTIIVNGTGYVYGLNIANAKDTTIENINITATSNYYADAIQIWDADTVTITGNVNSKATSEAYGVYSTAMGTTYSHNIDLTGLNITVESAKATGVLLEGAKDAILTNANYNIKGEQATAISSYPDWMGNIPSNITITGLTIEIDTTGDANAIYFGGCTDINITENTINSNGGSEILFNQTTNAKATNNYLVLGENLGKYAVISTEEDTVNEGNLPRDYVRELEDKIKELEEQLEQKDEEINNLTQNITDLQNNLTEAQNNITDLQNNLTEAQNNITDLQNNLT